MTRTSAYIAWSSIAFVGIGVAMHVVFQFNLSTGRWVAQPPPAGFGAGNPDDPIAACRDDLQAYCPEAQDLGRAVCLQMNLENLSPGCRAALAGAAPEASPNGDRAAGAGESTAMNDPRDFSGVWWNGPSPEPYALEHLDNPPVLNEAGEAAYNETEERKRAIDAAESDTSDVSNCVLVGVPRIWAQPYPFEIAVRPEDVIIVYEHLHSFRSIYMNQEPVTLETAIALNRYGNSVGYWEGDTLIIESLAFSDLPFLDETGLPQSEHLRTVERIRKLDEDTLEVVTTVEDPQYYDQPWTVRATFERQPDDVRVEEYVCGYGVLETRYTRMREAQQTG